MLLICTRRPHGISSVFKMCGIKSCFALLPEQRKAWDRAAVPGCHWRDRQKAQGLYFLSSLPCLPLLPLLPTTPPSPCYLSTFLTFLLVFCLFNPLSYLWCSVFSPFCHTLSRPLPPRLSPVSTLPLSLLHSPPHFISLSLLCHSFFSAHWLCNGTWGSADPVWAQSCGAC